MGKARRLKRIRKSFSDLEFPFVAFDLGAIEDFDKESECPFSRRLYRMTDTVSGETSYAVLHALYIDISMKNLSRPGAVHAEFEVLDESLNYKGHRFLANRCEELYEKPGFCESFLETIHDDEAKKHPFGKMDGFTWKCCQCGAVVFTPLDQFTNAWPVQLSFSERLDSKTMVLENWNNF